MGWDEMDDTEGIAEKTTDRISALYIKLKDAFERETNGLTLWLCYHNEDEGDRYDDVRGAFWTVGGMYVMSEQGKALNDKVGRGNQVQTNFYVTFG